MDTILINNITIKDIINELEKREIQATTSQSCDYFTIYGCMEFDSQQTEYERKSGKFEIGAKSNLYSICAVISFFLRCIYDKFDPKERLDTVIDNVNDSLSQDELEKPYDKNKIGITNIIDIIGVDEEHTLWRINEPDFLKKYTKKDLKTVLFEMNKYTLKDIKEYYSS